jgi:hypothetical protein
MRPRRRPTRFDGFREERVAAEGDGGGSVELEPPDVIVKGAPERSSLPRHPYAFDSEAVEL